MVMKAKLPLTVSGLLKFDPEYFDYLDPKNQDEDEKKFYKRTTATKSDLYCHLATSVFDTDEQYERLLEIGDKFGLEVMREVMVKLKDRDHDT